jgi:hypothetical protein
MPLAARLCYSVIGILVAITCSLRADAPLKNAREIVETTYDKLSGLSIDDRRAAYKKLPAAMQDDVWTVHLERFLATRFDLTDDERSVILEGLGFLATSPGSVGRHDAEWEIRVGRPLQQLSNRGKTLCRYEIIRAAFGVLGPEPQRKARQATVAPPNSAHLWNDKLVAHAGRGIMGPCTCNRNDDWCRMWPEDPLSCTEVDCTLTDDGCGWFWRKPCNGQCF